MNNMKTYQPKAKDIKREWHLIDAKGEILGRMSTRIAMYLMGKHKTSYANHMDMGDFVVVINAKEVEVTGRKKKQKTYKKHSGYPGGFKEIKYEKWLEESPEKIIEHAVAGMLPKNRLHQKRMRRLKVFSGSEHRFESHIKGSKQTSGSDRKVN